jgi:hypothetical protein
MNNINTYIVNNFSFITLLRNNNAYICTILYLDKLLGGTERAKKYFK